MVKPFFSILFPTEADQVTAVQEPPFFMDLNLPRIVYDVVPEQADDDLLPLFYAPLSNDASIRYRLDVFRAMEDADLRGEITAYMHGIKQVHAALKSSRAVRTREQKDKYLVDGAVVYCAALRRLFAYLSAHPSPAEGLQRLTAYLEAYVASEAFVQLERDTREAWEGLNRIAFSLRFFEDKLLLDFHPDESQNLHQGFRELFSHISDSPLDDVLAFFTQQDLTPLEAELLKHFRKHSPQAFARLEAVAAQYPDFVDPAMDRLAGDFRFYTLYVNFMEKLRERGMFFAYPELLPRKELHVTAGYDLALAIKHENAGQIVVPNDFYLEPEERIMVLAGPNQGGKTTFARSFGQIMYLAALGLPVPARSASLWRIGSLYTHFAVEEDLASHSGRLQEELLRLKEIYNAADADSLLIFNELFATTTTFDALHLGLRVLNWVEGQDAACLYVSHIADLAKNYGKAVSMVAEVVSPDNPVRTYRIRRREADGEAYANAIARRYALTYADICRRKGMEVQP